MRQTRKKFNAKPPRRAAPEKFPVIDGTERDGYLYAGYSQTVTNIVNHPFAAPSPVVLPD